MTDIAAVIPPILEYLDQTPERIGVLVAGVNRAFLRASQPLVDREAVQEALHVLERDGMVKSDGAGTMAVWRATAPAYSRHPSI